MKQGIKEKIRKSWKCFWRAVGIFSFIGCQAVIAVIIAIAVMIIGKGAVYIITLTFFDFKDGSYIQDVSLIPGKDATIRLRGGVDLEMIWIEPGTYTLGSPVNELGWHHSEVMHKVTLTKGFWLGKYEVTQAQWKAVMRSNPSKFIDNNNPVEGINWEDAMSFCRALTKQEQALGRLLEGYQYILPTSAQWEYACRAGTTTALNSGKNLSNAEKCPEMDEVGWYKYNSKGRTHPVGQKKPNAWGLYDMHGNVFEWCYDWAVDYPDGALTDPITVHEPNDKLAWHRILRGGCWFHDAEICRSAVWFHSHPTRMNNSEYHRERDGFRLSIASRSYFKKSSFINKLFNRFWMADIAYRNGSEIQGRVLDYNYFY